MAQRERDLNHQVTEGELSRARKRKIKRTGMAGVPPKIESPASEAGRSRVRATRGSRSSVRENAVADQIRGQSISLPSIKGTLETIINHSGQAIKGGRTSRSRRKEATSPRSATLHVATSRAETQRITSSDRSYQPPGNRRVYDAHSEAAPPVMVRGGMGGMAFGRVAHSRLQKQRTPRRRIDVPLRVTGAEMRLPSIPFINLGSRAFSLMMVVMMSACLFLMWQASIFQVKSIDAVGLKRLTVNDLNTVMGLAGKSVFTLNPRTLRETLSQAFPEFSKISVRIGLPASVKVVVTERQPVIAWTQAGVETWVDAEGVSFPPRGTPKTALVQVEGYGTQPGAATATSAGNTADIADSLPLLSTPNKPSLKLSPDLVSAVLAMGAKMPPDTMLVYDSERGLGWNDPNGWDVFFGAEDQDTEMKLIVYQALVERLKSEGIQPALISVEYVHAPYYRMER